MKRKSTSTKLVKPVKGPKVPAPKPLPKPAPVQLTPQEVRKQQAQQHQQLAKQIHQTLVKRPISVGAAGSQSSPEAPMNAGYDEREKDELVFHSRRQNPFKPLDIKNR